MESTLAESSPAHAAFSSQVPVTGGPGTGRMWPRLAGSLLLLLGEVGTLTYFVEFPRGPLEYVASARVCSGLLLALVAFLVLATAGARPGLNLADGPSKRGAMLWLASNLTLYAAFFAYTTWLAVPGGRTLSPWVVVPSWVLLALAIALTAVPAFFPWRALGSWLWSRRATAVIAAGLGLCLALVTPWVQGLWPRVCILALEIDRDLLTQVYGACTVGYTRNGTPGIATPRLLLLVTPQCSELDAIAAFWLLAGAWFVSRWPTLRKGRMVLVILLGTGLFYLVNALRLCGLVMIGTHVSPKACVSLAHSRVGGIGFLGLAVLLLAVTSRWCRRPRP